MGKYSYLNFNDQQLRLGLVDMSFPMDESDWQNSQKFLDDIYADRKLVLANRNKKIIVLTVITLISSGLFAFILFKDRLIPKTNQFKSAPAVSEVEDQIKAGKIFSDVGPLEMTQRKVVLKQKAVVVKQESDTLQGKVEPKVSDRKTDSTSEVRSSSEKKVESKNSSEAVTTAEKKGESKSSSTKKKKKEKEKETKSKKTKKKSSSSLQPVKHTTKDDEVIISE
jgi:hypothetical protein